MSTQLEKKTDNNKTFLVYKINSDDIIDEMSVNMLKNNLIPHILPVSFTQIDDEKFLKYDVTSKISLSDAIQYPISKERFLAIYDGIFSGILGIDDYMIPSNSVLLNFDDIYFDEFNENIFLISFPVNVAQQSQPDLESFVRLLANKVQLKTNDEFMTGKILNKLNQTQTFSAAEFKKFINSLMNKKAPQIQPPIQSASPVQPVQPRTTAPNNRGVINVAPPQPPRQPQPPVVDAGGRTAPPSTPIPQPKKVNVPTNTGGGMNIPGKPQNNGKQPSQVQPTQPEAQQEKPMSLFYLLQHYNSENAAIYKRQKEAKKNGTQAAPSQNGGNFTVPNQTPQSGQPVQNTPQAPYYVERRQPQKRDFGNTTVLNKKKKTTVLNNKTVPSQNTQKRAMLVRKRTNEIIMITKVPFKIGASEDGDVDYVIKGNTNISQTHAIIGYEVNGYTIMDDHSTNGTYLNANPLSNGKFMLLNSGDLVRLADEDFKFELN